MSTVILTTGLPGSGKTTWVRKQLEEHGENAIAVSRDEIRQMIGAFPVGTKSQEDLVSKIQDDIIVRGVKEGKTVYVHDTNLNKKSPTRIKKLFDGDIIFYIADFTEVPVDLCIERDAKRANSVGPTIIKNMARQLQKPWRLTPEFMNDYMPLETYELPSGSVDRVVVFDIDGTLARHHRSPYDYNSLHTDTVFDHIRTLTNFYYDNRFIVYIVSGRPDSHRIETEEWLDKHAIPHDALFMRRADDKRNDSDVKHEIFNEHIRHLDVEAWFDDRDRVVRRMRKLGLNVLQVAPGDF